MWFKSYDSLSKAAKKRIRHTLDVKSAREMKLKLVELFDLVLENNKSQDPLAKAKEKALGNLANNASFEILSQVGIDWFKTNKGLSTLSNSFEKIVEEVFKGRAFKPDNNTFIAPNLFQALKMRKAGVDIIKAMPKHLRGKKLHGEICDGYSGRFPSNNADNPVKVKYLLNEKLNFCIYGLEVIVLQVADVDGDKAAEILKLDSVQMKALETRITGEERLADAIFGKSHETERQSKSFKLQSMWNLLVDLQVEKTFTTRTEIEDVCPIQVLKTLNSYSEGCEHEAIILEALMYPNQGPVGPVANHIQSAALNGLMTPFLMLVFGALLQNIIDSQKSLNDFYWLIKPEETFVDKGVLKFPSPDKWKSVSEIEIAKLLMESPYAWRGSNEASSYMDFSPELLISVKMKEAMKLYPIVFASKGDTVKWTYEDKTYAVHIDWFRFFKTQSPYIPSIPAMSHWIKYQLGFPEDYSQAKTPWHQDSTGTYVHTWKDEYVQERYCDAGDNSILGVWYDIVKDWAEKSWIDPGTQSNSDVLFVSSGNVSQETKEFLLDFRVSKDLNAFTSSNVPKHIARDIVENFHEASKRFLTEKPWRGQTKTTYWLMDLLDLATTKDTTTFLKELPLDIWYSDCVPFGAKYHSKGSEKPFGDIKSRTLTGLLRNRHSEDDDQAKTAKTAITRMALLDDDVWSGKKAQLCRIFEFFAAQCLPSACPIWTNMSDKIEKVDKSKWAEVYQMVSTEHGHPLQKCPCCYKEFLAWSGKKKVSLVARRFQNTIAFLQKAARALDSLRSLGIPEKFLPEWYKAMDPTIIKTDGFSLDELQKRQHLKDIILGEEIDWDALGKLDEEEMEDFANMDW